jgi:hypothetical protein
MAYQPTRVQSCHHLEVVRVQAVPAKLLEAHRDRHQAIQAQVAIGPVLLVRFPVGIEVTQHHLAKGHDLALHSSLLH